MARKTGTRYRRRRGALAGLALLSVAGVFYSWYFRGFWRGSSTADETAIALAPLTSDRPLSALDHPGPYAHVRERGVLPQDSATPAPPQVRKLIESARQQTDNPIAVRQQLSEALKSAGPSDMVDLRAELIRLGQETIFSKRVFQDDPLTELYIVRSGEVLDGIGKKYAVTGALLARINGISNPNLIRAGQTLKVIKGPFHARVSKSLYRLDVYLQDTFVQSFPVGLGAEDSTPSGTWKVTEKLVNPRYYPPRGGKIIEADDPQNPLGERWIALEGIEGAAVGQLRYGIHGTIDPSSIGKNVSMGCIRMHNADVEILFDMLVVGKSTVVVTD